MSFYLELDVEDLTHDQARAVEQTCRERAAWPIAIPRRRRRLFSALRHREIPFPDLCLPDSMDGEDLLSDQATWDAPAWEMNENVVPAFAEGLRILGEILTQGYALRATWVGSEARQERTVSADELVEIARASQLNEFTRYRVPSIADET